MLKRIFKYIGIGFGCLIGLIAVGYLFIYINLRGRLATAYDVEPEAIHVNYDSSSIALGARLVGTRACNDCHAPDFGGRILLDDPLIGFVSTRNLTHGKGGLPSDFSERDWVMALKHGLQRDKTPLIFMPANEFSEMSESDMAAIVAYMSTVPSVDRELPSLTVGPLGYMLSFFDVIPLIPAEKTDHVRPFAKEVQPAVTAEYGRYLAVVCTNCHGPQLKGRGPMIPGGPPAPDLSATGNPGQWSHGEFIKTLRTGARPDGSKLKEDMPWKMTLSFSEEELTAIHVYAQSLK
jgi:mono/diheme cytochrome c family protein